MALFESVIRVSSEGKNLLDVESQHAKFMKDTLLFAPGPDTRLSIETREIVGNVSIRPIIDNEVSRLSCE